MPKKEKKSNSFSCMGLILHRLGFYFETKTKMTTLRVVLTNFRMKKYWSTGYFSINIYYNHTLSISQTKAIDMRIILESPKTQTYNQL